jgi:hypothetical protein
MSRIQFSKPQQSVGAAALRAAHHAAVRLSPPPDPAGALLYAHYAADALPKNFLSNERSSEEAGRIFLGEGREGGTQNLLTQDPSAEQNTAARVAASPF